MENVFKKAHEITKNIIRKGDSYRETFRLSLIFVYSQIKKRANKMVELKGSEKQIKWANDIREIMIECLNKSLKFQEEDAKEYEEKRGKQSKIKTRLVNSIKDFIIVVENQESSAWFIENFKCLTSVDRDRAGDILFDTVLGRR